ncbi:intraflagellar transport protein 74 homolog [Uloborus diversus]|uniref:intraflagellar transport protein 74 homolog n=1 Tax=Uloborus diversus TaxID=327109 RepID=UPI002408F9FA|nr:intraflagellar transport protein 74 homolog [Uloborus diversus]
MPNFEQQTSFSRKSRSSLSISSTSGSMPSTYALRNPIYNTDMKNILVLEQGLVIPKQQNAKASGRKVLDKSFFKGLLLQKKTELQNEIDKLVKDIYHFSQELSSKPFYQKEAETLAKEIQELRFKFSIYNIVDDITTTEIEMVDAEKELDILRAQNSLMMKSIEKLFNLQKKKECVVKELLSGINEESNISDILKLTASTEMQNKISDLKKIDMELSSQLETQNEELHRFESVRETLELQLSKLDQVQAKELLVKLQKLKQKKEEQLFLFRDLSSEDLLEKEKAENEDLLLYILKCTRIVNGNISRMKNYVQDLKKEDSLNAERCINYDKLKSKEEIIDNFLSSFDENRIQLMNTIEYLQQKIVNLSYVTESGVPEKEISSEEDILVKKQYELLGKLSALDSLGSKIYEELKNFNEEIFKLQTKCEALNALSKDDIYRVAQMKIKNLLKEKKGLLKKKRCMLFVVDELDRTLKHLQKKLNENQVHLELRELENKWHKLEQENFAMKEFIVAKREEMNYLPVKENDIPVRKFIVKSGYNPNNRTFPT